MKTVFEKSFRSIQINKNFRYFCEKNKVLSKKIETVKTIPEKSIPYEKKLNEIFNVVTDMHQNNNFFKIVYYRFFKSLDIYKKNKFIEEIGTIIFTHSTSRRYYIINALFLFSYIIYSYYISKNDDVPESIKKTSFRFSIAALIVLFSMFYYSRKHIKKLYYHKTNRNFEIITYHFIGFSDRKYSLAAKDLKKVVPLVKGKLQQRSGIYSLEFIESGKRRNFYFRPHEIVNNELFDILIKKKIEI